MEVSKERVCQLLLIYMSRKANTITGTKLNHAEYENKFKIHDGVWLEFNLKLEADKKSLY